MPKKVSATKLKFLKMKVMGGRRETVYKFMKKKYGEVPCYVCSRHVKEKNATLEHIIPLSKGGTDEMDNLSISHFQCNQARGNNEDFSWNQIKSEEEFSEVIDSSLVSSLISD
jgi:hypothetical protein